MADETAIRDALLGLDELADEDLRDRIVQVWETALDKGDYGTLEEIEWIPELEGIADGADQLSHQSDVTAIAIALVDVVTEQRPELDIDRDTVIAGALLHDVSKLVERSDEFVSSRASGSSSYLPHPHYGVHLLAEAGMPLHLQHIVLSHSPLSNVEPQTIEADIVTLADEIAASILLWEMDEMLFRDL